jgi:hypothetical protein
LFWNLSKPSTTTCASLVKKSSNGLTLDENAQTSQSQMKLMPILESGENEDKSNQQQQQQTRFSKDSGLMTTTFDWTPMEYVHSKEQFVYLENIILEMNHRHPLLLIEHLLMLFLN